MKQTCCLPENNDTQGIVKFSFSLKVLTNENGGLPGQGIHRFLLYLSGNNVSYSI